MYVIKSIIMTQGEADVITNSDEDLELPRNIWDSEFGLWKVQNSNLNQQERELDYFTAI